MPPASEPPPLPAHLQDLTERARAYVEAASSTDTRRAYASDWKHFAAWCRRQNVAPLPPDPQVVGLYITACASGTAERGMKANTVSTIERCLWAISWNCAQRGMALNRKDRAIATVMAGIRNTHASRLMIPAPTLISVGASVVDRADLCLRRGCFAVTMLQRTDFGRAARVQYALSAPLRQV